MHILSMGMYSLRLEIAHILHMTADLIEKHQLPNDDPLTEEQQQT